MFHEYILCARNAKKYYKKRKADEIPDGNGDDQGEEPGAKRLKTATAKAKVQAKSKAKTKAKAGAK